ncbi:MXAN_6230/SCO0854 family RING domain-containing protein [Myxococcus vastator]|uniref:MXAN_6230/SCO0854 family RING domain-containing protein n=1 Tax=Myxococcus vastator TaxID=2709664 RepID=UPI0013D3161B|nr:MXAN_6230/SCO0854 family RING domain-containing protein [Myxococcus vastator]
MGAPSLDVTGDTAALLLRTTGRVFLPSGLSPSGDPRAREQGMEALEADLAGVGYTLDGPLREALLALPTEVMAASGRFVYDTCAAALGANRPFVPLFRNFPESVPHDTHRLYVQRMLGWLFQSPEQPCIHCGAQDTVHALSPCAHLVCERCYDGSDYSACPSCHSRLSPSEPFLKPTALKAAGSVYGQTAGRLTRLSLGTDPEATASEVLRRLVSRSTVLRPGEVMLLKLLVSSFGVRILGWLPPRIPVKETLAHVMGLLLQDAPTAGDVLASAAAHVKTATDVLRVLVAWAGGNPDLTVKIPLKSPPRPVRRAVLRMLEGCSVLNLTEDLRRHAGLWKAQAKLLHVFEEWQRHPKVALAFAVLRETVLAPETPFGAAVLGLASEHPAEFQRLEVDGGVRLSFRSWGSHVEAALDACDVRGALRLLRQRPGELLRRLDYVSRLSVAQSGSAALDPELLAALEAVLPRAAPALLLTAAAHLRQRHKPFARRVFFPKGEATHAWGMEDRRPLLPGDAIGQLVAPLERELLRRAEALPTFPQAVLDEALADLLVPLAEKTASRALVAVPRGSLLPLPEGKTLRFFVHWTEPKGTRVDLDLSVAFYDKDWWLVDLCDFTNLRLADDAAVHSGDVTSGPLPLGGAEFLDVHAPRLLAQGVRYAIPVVFSYNSVSFDRMEDAFAGFMVREGAGGPHFDARAVEQRFDLQGSGQISVPLVIDLVEKQLRWVDVKVPPEDDFQSVRRSRGELAHLGKDTLAYFGTGARPTLWELACLHAAARSRTVQVRRRDGSVSVLKRAPGEDTAAFLRRLRGLEAEATTHAFIPGTAPTFFAGMTDVPSLPAGSEGYALRFLHTSAESVTRLAAGDLVSALKA